MIILAEKSTIDLKMNWVTNLRNNEMIMWRKIETQGRGSYTQEIDRRFYLTQ